MADPRKLPRPAWALDKADATRVRCEVCNTTFDEAFASKLCGCEHCGRLFAPCCNSVDDDLCTECYEQRKMPL
jgi:protein-arginine kinase activator protein McsA